jgi:hypothetical protein
MSNDRYQEIRDALAKGPTPGEWYWSDAYPTQDGRETWSLIGDGGFGILSCDGEENSPQSVNAAAAELIAACDPDTIRALLEERDELVKLVMEMRGTLRDLRMHLHAAGRRPEECYEMSMIDDALHRAAIDRARGRGEP